VNLILKLEENRKKKNPFSTLIYNRKKKIINQILLGGSPTLASKLRRDAETPEEREFSTFLEEKAYYHVSYREEGLKNYRYNFYKGTLNYFIKSSIYDSSILWGNSSKDVKEYKRVLGGRYFKDRDNLKLFSRELVCPINVISYVSWISDLSVFFQLPYALINRKFKQRFKITNNFLSFIEITTNLTFTFNLAILIAYDVILERINNRELLQLFLYDLSLESSREILFFDNPSKRLLSLLKIRSKNLFKTIIISSSIENNEDLNISRDSAITFQYNNLTVPQNTNLFLNFTRDYVFFKLVFSRKNKEVSEEAKQYTDEELTYVFGKEPFNSSEEEGALVMGISEIILLLSFKIATPIFEAYENKDQLTVSYLLRTNDIAAGREGFRRVREVIEKTTRVLEITEREPSVKEYFKNK